jgi:hypothetical protein
MLLLTKVGTCLAQKTGLGCQGTHYRFSDYCDMYILDNEQRSSGTRLAMLRATSEEKGQYIDLTKLIRIRSISEKQLF